MIQGGEVIIIALVALIVLGPNRLPELARKIGQWSTELRKAAREITAGLEAEVGDLKKIGDDLKAPLEDLSEPIKDIQRDIDDAGVSGFDWTGPKPVSGPTPEDAMRDLEELEAKSDEAPEDESPDDESTGSSSQGTK